MGNPPNQERLLGGGTGFQMYPLTMEVGGGARAEEAETARAEAQA